MYDEMDLRQMVTTLYVSVVVMFVIFALILIGLIWLFNWFTEEKQTDWQKSAYEVGVGEFVVDPATGETEFRWKACECECDRIGDK